MQLNAGQQALTHTTQEMLLEIVLNRTYLYSPSSLEKTPSASPLKYLIYSNRPTVLSGLFSKFIRAMGFVLCTQPNNCVCVLQA
jgi:hypothetical protein